MRTWTIYTGCTSGGQTALWSCPYSGRFGPKLPLTVRAVQTIVMRRAAAVGVDSASGHSLRVGSAQSLAARGATLPELQAVGRWADPAMPGRYCRAQSAGQSAVARLRGD